MERQCECIYIYRESAAQSLRHSYLAGACSGGSNRGTRARGAGGEYATEVESVLADWPPTEPTAPVLAAANSEGDATPPGDMASAGVDIPASTLLLPPPCSGVAAAVAAARPKGPAGRTRGSLVAAENDSSSEGAGWGSDSGEARGEGDGWGEACTLVLPTSPLPESRGGRARC